MAEQKSLESIRDEEKEKICTDCGSRKIEYDNGEYYCKKCGLVLD